MAVNYHLAHRYLGHWVYCHSIYGIHRGVLTRVLPSGIVLTRTVYLASTDNGPRGVRLLVSAVDEGQNAHGDIVPAQFFGGFFVPFGGIYGLYPGFGFVI
ncbi:hypothetical protein [Alicyclobacillus shizuokensis]|uniref:hypothetical protein n=1 Tax=Alicyclobacillus shizuokensis TaxID=392014 RepID=UPI00083536E2|nr:hypothetical protein [Alicyclobacillus shizuokensis]MCL6625789.1 hypothetical protein [Alicyclobacillus shizuokensis]